MTSLQMVAGGVAGIVSAAGFVPYIVAVITKRARPNAATWFIWTLVGTILGASCWTAGARASIGVAVTYAAGPLVTTIVALKYGDRSFSRLDVACLAAALGSLVLWTLSGDPLVAMGLNILIDILGAIPTLRKAWYEPGSEDKLSWGLFAAGNAINLVAIESWTLTGALYPVYLFLLTSMIAAFVARRR